MKLTKNRLKILIKEEYSKIIKEMNYQAHALGTRHLSKLEDDLYDMEEDYEELEDEAEQMGSDMGGYEPTNVDKVYEIIQSLLDASNVGADRQGEIAMELANMYDASTENPHEILNHAEDILKTDAGNHDEDEGLSRGSLYRKRYYGRY